MKMVQIAFIGPPEDFAAGDDESQLILADEV